MKKYFSILLILFLLLSSCGGSNETQDTNSEEKDLITINPFNIDERLNLSNKILELESSLEKPISLLQNQDFHESHPLSTNSCSLFTLFSLKVVPK